MDIWIIILSDQYARLLTHFYRKNLDHLIGESVALLVARWTNNRKVVGSRPAKVVCITVLTGNRLG